MDHSFYMDRDPTELYLDGNHSHSAAIDRLRATGPTTETLAEQLRAPQRKWRMMGPGGWVATADILMRRRWSR